MIIIEEIVRALELPPNGQVHSEIVQKWHAPEDGWIKINTDGATNPGRNTGGAGIIARNNQGVCLRADCIRYDGVTDPLSIEILASVMRWVCPRYGT